MALSTQPFKGGHAHTAAVNQWAQEKEHSCWIPTATISKPSAISRDASSATRTYLSRRLTGSAGAAPALCGVVGRQPELAIIVRRPERVPVRPSGHEKALPQLSVSLCPPCVDRSRRK